MLEIGYNVQELSLRALLPELGVAFSVQDHKL